MIETLIPILSLPHATAFGAIISLIRVFKQEVGDRIKADRQTFLDWLETHRHEELKTFIANTAAVRGEVDKILAADHTQMLHKLDEIQAVVATLLSRVDEFRGLSAALAPDAQLSDQAVSILRQFADSGAEILFYSGNTLQPDNSEPLVITEPRFLHSDLEQLVELSLLTLSHGSGGNPLFRPTRNGARYLQTMQSKSPA